MTLRVCDYLANFLYNSNIRHVFMVSGGGMMFLSDGIAAHPNLKVICHHHEQAAAMAAVSYAKYLNGVGICCVTTGCGGTNTITAVLQSWQDSIPCIFISGQSKRKETIRNSDIQLRQFGVQEADIVSIVASITKYAIMINNPKMISYYLEKAFYIAKNGRPGPVWLDIPLDVQSAVICESELLHFSKNELSYESEVHNNKRIYNDVFSFLEKAKRPIIIAGQGIRLSNAIDEFKQFINCSKIPFVVTKMAIDILPFDNPYYIGRIGNKGTRAGNFSLQNADVVLVLGSRLSVSTTGHEYDLFAREAKIIVVDIDNLEHKKNTVKIDLFLKLDVKLFLENILQSTFKTNYSEWLIKCEYWKDKFPIFTPQINNQDKRVNLYTLVNAISKKLHSNSTVIFDAGYVSYAVHQGIINCEGQRVITSGSQGEMGFALPAAIGVSYANTTSNVVIITGDGSLQMNIQELQTIIYHNLPIKIFVCNNNGYLSIRSTQKKFFNGRTIGSDPSSGISFPSLEKIAQAYGISYIRIESEENILNQIEFVLKQASAIICEVMCLEDQEIIPTVSSYKQNDGTLVSKPLEDMYPFLNRDEFFDEMIIKPIQN